METNPQRAMALLTLSHSPAEHLLYESLLAATGGEFAARVGSFSLRQLLGLTGLGSYSTLRRARAGLVAKLSIECKRSAGDDGSAAGGSGSFYLVYGPEEIFERRLAAGLDAYPKEYHSHAN